LSFDATIRSNVTVGPPIDLLLYRRDSLDVTKYRRLNAMDPDLTIIHTSWEQALRRAVEQLPEIQFENADDRRAMVAGGRRVSDPGTT
jgi:putative proteasome-type protease